MTELIRMQYIVSKQFNKYQNVLVPTIYLYPRSLVFHFSNKDASSTYSPLFLQLGSCVAKPAVTNPFSMSL